MRMSSLIKELKEICSDLQIHDKTTFSFRGELFQVPQEDVNLKQQDENLVASVLEVLYSQCYMRTHKAELEWYDPSQIEEWRSHLTQANQTKKAWDRGWKIYQVNPDGRISILKADRSRAANPGEFVRDELTGHGPQVGQLVELCVYPGTWDLHPGFYFAFGSTLTDQFDEYALVRFYFNVTSFGAVELLRQLSTSLNFYHIPFRYKCLADPRSYQRADAAVLYISKRYLNIVADLVEVAYPTFKPYLRSEIPLLCYEFLPGVGMADDTGTGESFGKHRCKLLAQALVYAWRENVSSVEEKLNAVQTQFEREGLSLEAPYLNAAVLNIFPELNRSGVPT